MFAISNVIRIRSSSVMGSNCEAVVNMLSMDERREKEGAACFFFFSRLGTTYLLAVISESQLEGRLMRAGRLGRGVGVSVSALSGNGSVL